ncbi:MAG: DsrE family protein [Anaerolineaceae bacterium]
MTVMLYVGTHGPDDPTRATFPFHFAKGALDAGFTAKVFLAGDAALLLKESIVNEIRGVAVPPLANLMRTVVEGGCEVHV